MSCFRDQEKGKWMRFVQGRLPYPDCQSVVSVKERRRAFNPDLDAEQTNADQSGDSASVGCLCYFSQDKCIASI